MSTAKFNQWLNSDGTENYKCRAWVNFNGTGTIAIKAAGNVSSVVDTAVGDYTINFTNPLLDANYAVTITADVGGSANAVITMTRDDVTPRTTSSVKITIRNYAGTAVDSTAISVLVVR